MRQRNFGFWSPCDENFCPSMSCLFACVGPGLRTFYCGFVMFECVAVGLAFSVSECL